MGVLGHLDAQAAQRHVASVHVRIDYFDGSAVFHADCVLDKRIHYVE